MKHRRALMLLAGMLGLGAGAAALAGKDPEERYIVKYREGVTAGALRMGPRSGLRVERELPRHNAAALRLSRAEAAVLAQDPTVEFVEPDPVRVPVSVVRAKPSGADIVAAGAASNSQIIPYGLSLVKAVSLGGVPSAGIKVCVIDSGYELGHEDKPMKPLVSGDDDIAGTGLWSTDETGHGTHVSGIINARNNTIGVLGVFPRVPMHIVKVFGDSDTWTYSSDLVAALDRCIAAGAKVINLSLGGSDTSRTELVAFRKARAAGVITVAAAGNDGTSALSYPAAYPSVISVAALDENLQRASFSNFSSTVSFAAPGVSVLSTVPRGSSRRAELETALGSQSVAPMDNFPTPTAPVSGPIADCGLAGTAADCAGANGGICLIERGTYLFAEKAQNCEAAGGIGAVIYNRADESGLVYGTLGDVRVSIPVVGTDRNTGLSLRQAYLGTTATLRISSWPYDYFSGTSMATPYVAGVAALVWSRHPRCSNEVILQALFATAQDLGLVGPDPDYGSGLIKARAANTWLDSQPCSATPR